MQPISPGLDAEATKATLWVFPSDRPHGWRSKRRVDRAVFHFSSVPEKMREACAARGFFRVGLEQADVEMIRGLARSLEPHYRAPTSSLCAIIVGSIETAGAKDYLLSGGGCEDVMVTVS